MAKHIPVPLDIDDPAIDDINQMIHRRLTGGELGVLDYCRDAGAAFIFLQNWVTEQYILNPRVGNVLTIRDTRMRIGQTLVWTRWRISLYYYDPEARQSKWHTMKHRNYAFAVTCAVLQAYIHQQYDQ